jgi:hypothetical protein
VGSARQWPFVERAWITHHRITTAGAAGRGDGGHPHGRVEAEAVGCVRQRSGRGECRPNPLVLQHAARPYVPSACPVL